MRATIEVKNKKDWDTLKANIVHKQLENLKDDDIDLSIYLNKTLEYFELAYPEFKEKDSERNSKHIQVTLDTNEIMSHYVLAWELANAPYVIISMLLNYEQFGKDMIDLFISSFPEEAAYVVYDAFKELEVFMPLI